MDINLSVKRELARCFYLEIPIVESDDEMQELISHTIAVEKAVSQMMDGLISPEDLLDAVEPFVPLIDDYIEEAEEGIEKALIKTYQCFPTYIDD